MNMKVIAGWTTTLLVSALGLSVAAQQTIAQQVPSWSIAVRPQLSIGEADGPDEYSFKSIVSARFLPDGRVVVADAGYFEVRIYGSDGAVKTKFGRSGQGPREFAEMSGLWITSQGKIAVWDAGTRRITVLDSQGQFENTHAVRGPLTSGLEIFFGSFRNDDIALGALSFGQQTREPGLVPDRDSVFVNDDYDGEVSVRDGRGRAVRTIALPAVRRVSADAVWATLETRVREANKTVFLSYLDRGAVPKDDRFPQVGGLLTDDTNNLWVKTFDPFSDSIWLKDNALRIAPGGEWRILSAEGKLIANVRMPDSVRPLDIKGNRLLGVSIDELGVQRIVVHTIQR